MGPAETGWNRSAPRVAVESRLWRRWRREVADEDEGTLDSRSEGLGGEEIRCGAEAARVRAWKLPLGESQSVSYVTWPKKQERGG
jgi:hypothetical protein